MDRIRAEAVDDTIHVSVMMRLGMPETTIYRRCRDGDWTLMAPATIRLSNGTATRRQLVRAGLIYAGPQALVTGLDAARAHQLRRGDLPAFVHLLIPAGLRVHGLPSFRIERTKRMPPAMTRDDLPVASLDRSVLDAVRGMRSKPAVAAILTEPVQRRMTLVETLRTELDAGSRRGSAIPRAVLRAAENGVRSAAEFDFHEWWLAQPELSSFEIRFNVRVRNGAGLLGIADGYLPEIGLVLPIDSVEQHFMTPEQVEETERQHRSYRSAGLHVFGIRPSRMRTDSGGLLRDVFDAIAVAERLPTPLVQWEPDLPRAS
jgi:hypothetical protein